MRVLRLGEEAPVDQPHECQAEDRHEEEHRRRRSDAFEYRIVTSSGEERWLLGSTTLVELRDGPATLGTVIDITRRKLFEENLARRAFYDALTGLPNRSLFLDRLEHSLDAAARRRTPIAIMFVDLDGFKAVNDRFGHRAGDELLVAVASRLHALVRRGDTVARCLLHEQPHAFDDRALSGLLGLSAASPTVSEQRIN